jgi:hypothetical protein
MQLFNDCIATSSSNSAYPAAATVNPNRFISRPLYLLLMRSRRGELRVLDLLIACTALDSWGAKQ